jgi:thiazole/oxazole-forming peptide maturase SagD family component
MAMSPTSWFVLQGLLCPLSGPAQAIGFVKRAPLEPRVTIAGGEMTGVHLLRGLPPPHAGAYHIGGSGITYEEAVIRTLAETIERYADFTAVAMGRHPIRRATLTEMQSSEWRVLVAHQLQFFSSAQLGRPGFPFSPVGPESVIGWVSATSLDDGSPTWVPAQQALVGYLPQGGEPRFMAGVTTGTAAHRRYEEAIRHALLELVQVDAAIGHWYGNALAVHVEPSARTRSVDALIRERLHSDGPVAHFYWLPGLAIACVLQAVEMPRVAIGLGCDLRLSRAIYRAFLEATAVAQLAKIIAFRQTVDEAPHAAAGIDQDQFFDLDSNVAHYARHGIEAIQSRFGEAPAASASDLPPDVDSGPSEEVRLLIRGFSKAGKALAFLDLTTSDVREMGFRVVRLWSPDLLSIPMPSAPPLSHPRFMDYGGATSEAPHPYP